MHVCISCFCGCCNSDEKKKVFKQFLNKFSPSFFWDSLCFQKGKEVSMLNEV